MYVMGNIKEIFTANRRSKVAALAIKKRLGEFKKKVDPSEVGGTALVDWLRDRNSLTSRLQARGAFNLRVLKQGLGMPTLNEAVALGLRRRQIAWIREVALYCDGEPVVFAHTVLPYRPRGPLTRWLARLGNRSLGALLFSHAGFTRGPLVSRRLDPRDALFARAVAAMNLSSPAAPAILWARRSSFSFGRQRVLVTEVFSPSLGA